MPAKTVFAEGGALRDFQVKSPAQAKLEQGTRLSFPVKNQQKPLKSTSSRFVPASIQ
jgi:hypothetical protein